MKVFILNDNIQILLFYPRLKIQTVITKHKDKSDFTFLDISDGQAVAFSGDLMKKQKVVTIEVLWKSCSYKFDTKN